jgi:hypothetical protein
MFRYYILFVLVFSSISLFAVDKDPNAIVESYEGKLKKLTALFTKQAARYKKDAIAKLEVRRRQLIRKDDSDGVKALGDLIERLKKRSLSVNVAEGGVGDLDDDYLDGVPPPPGEYSPAPLSKAQLEAGKKVKSRRITKPKALHKALAALNPAYNMDAADFVVENGSIVKVRLSNTGLVNIAPLAGLKHVREINLDSNPIWNLKPLSKLHLNGLSLSNTDVRNLTPIKGMKLYWLNISGTKITDLSPIKKMPLTALYMSRCVFLKEIAPVKRLKNLEELLLSVHLVRNGDLQFLKKLKNLRYIDTNWKENKQPAEVFWRNLDKQ